MKMGKIARQKTFVPDQRKAGGSYHTISGQIKKIDDYQKQVILMDKTRIDVDCILDGYTGALKAPVRCFGNHLSEKRKSLFQTDNKCGGAAILKNRTSRMGTPVGC